MSSSNPDITASDIITDVEARMLNPNLSSAIYLPWVSYAYQKTYQALAKSSQAVKERFFGTSTTFDLTAGIAEYSLETNIPRFGGIIKVEIKYGKTGDDWERATFLESLSDWKIQNNTSTSYRGKASPLYYVIGDTLGFIPTPPASESDQTPQAKVYHINRPYQITLTTDVIDIPYRFIYPIADYVHARAVQRLNEDYSASRIIESNFIGQLEEVAEAAASEFSENEESNFVKIPGTSPIFNNPFGNEIN